MTGQWWMDPTAIAFIIKLSGGLAVSAAQVFGLAIYTLNRDLFWKWLYVGATIISVTISVLTFQSMIQSGAITAKHNTTEYQAMATEKSRLISAIDEQRKRKKAIVDKYTAMNWLDYASKKEADYEKLIMVYEEKLSTLQQKLTDYIQSARNKDFVSASTTYTALGSDVVGFFGLPQWVGVKFSILLSYAMLIAVALAIDLTGTKLFAFAIGEADSAPTEAIVGTSESHLQTGAESGAEIEGNMEVTEAEYVYKAVTPYERVKGEYEKMADSYTGAERRAESVSATRAENGEDGAESGAEMDQVNRHHMDINPELLGRIIDAYGTEKSINAVQNKVWETGKSSRRREIVLAVGDAYGLRIGGNGQNRLAA
jgi:hypothetical protein